MNVKVPDFNALNNRCKRASLKLISSRQSYKTRQLMKRMLTRDKTDWEFHNSTVSCSNSRRIWKTRPLKWLKPLRASEEMREWRTWSLNCRKCAIYDQEARACLLLPEGTEEVCPCPTRTLPKSHKAAGAGAEVRPKVTIVEIVVAHLAAIEAEESHLERDQKVRRAQDAFDAQSQRASQPVAWNSLPVRANRSQSQPSQPAQPHL